ncbi:hypothetical protein Tco_0463655, partial [Tanacetum coccineum]
EFDYKVSLHQDKDEGTLSEEHKVQEEDTTHRFFDDTADQDAAVTPDLERKSDGTEEVNMFLLFSTSIHAYNS